jgi:type VI secretion system protein ImpF
MAELTPQERLQPALLDRLVDDDPQNKTKEARDRRVLNKQRFRQAVLRDLAWLFNATNLASSEDLSQHPEVARSVVNFGLPALAGQTTSALDIVDLERLIRQAIVDFEPRILPGTLEVEPIVSDAQIDHHNIVSIRIRGTLWAQPVPLELLLQTDVDLETGAVEIRDLTRSG